MLKQVFNIYGQDTTTWVQEDSSASSSEFQGADISNREGGIPLLGELTPGSTAPLPNGTGDVFKAFTKTEFGSSLILLTPFTGGANANASLFPGSDIGNASLKVFFMGVGIGGVYSTRANAPSVSAAISGGFSFLIGREDPTPVEPTPRQ